MMYFTEEKATAGGFGANMDLEKYVRCVTDAPHDDATTAAPAEDAPQSAVFVYNWTEGDSFWYLYARSSNSDGIYSDSWGKNLLGSEEELATSKDNFFRVTLPVAGTYDFLAADSENYIFFKRGVTVVRGFQSLTFTINDFAGRINYDGDENDDPSDHMTAKEQFSFGMRYYGAESYTEAARWFRMAAERGNADAQYMLGGLYSDGRGVAQDYAEALKWYRMAAEQGLYPAQTALKKMQDAGLAD